MGIGVVGFVASIAFYWKILPSKKTVPRKLTRALMGESLTNADIALDEIVATEIT